MAKFHALCHFGRRYTRMHETDGNALIFQIKTQKLVDHVQRGCAGTVAIFATTINFVPYGDAACSH